MKILKQTKNPFLHREEYSIQITADKTPSFVDVKKELGTNEELTIVKNIDGNFGRETFSVNALVYDTKENMSKVEKISRKERKKINEAKKAEAAAATK